MFFGEILEGLFPVRVNVGEEAFRANVRSAIARDLPWLQQSEAKPGFAVLVAGGPSLSRSLDSLRRHAQAGHTIFAMNNTAKYLLNNGITPDYNVLLDAKPSTKRFVQPKIKTLIASQCAPGVFSAAKDAILWHPAIKGIEEFIGDRTCALIGGGTTVGLQCMSIAYTLGFRNIILYGYDSSYEGLEGHAYVQPENNGEPVVDVWFDGKKYVCAPWMIVQTEEFKGVLRQLVDLDCSVSVAGDGFLPATFRDMMKTTMTAVYDLSLSPPTYDFLSFLLEAERERIKRGHTHIDVVFIPGPKGGFRDDTLAPSQAAREGMLHRVCVSACRLLPSIRNVTVRKDRQDVSGDIFPAKWTPLTPRARYGNHYMVNAHPILRATQSAKEFVASQSLGKYVTITIRNAEYWPDRNSNIAEWKIVAKALEAKGFNVLWIDDCANSSSVFSWDLDFRLAAYEGAACNLGITNGPMELLRLSNAPYLWFRVVTETVLFTTIAYWENCGFKKGSQLSKNGITIWEDDTADVILKAFDEFHSNNFLTGK